MNDDKINMVPEADIEELSAYFPWENWSEIFWGFTCFSRQKYADKLPQDADDEIMLGLQCESGGCLCELAFRWHMIAGSTVPRLEVYDSAWPVFQTPTFAAVMQQLSRMAADGNELTPDEVSALLIANGFKDESDRPLDHTEGGCQQEVRHG